MKKKTTLESLQHEYDFKLPLSAYTMGVSGDPEEREQKAFFHCLCGEFPDEIGFDEEEFFNKRTKRTETRDIYRAIMVSTSNFFDRYGKKMKNFKSMGYQKHTPDMIFMIPRGHFHGLVIEMKSETGTASAGQKKTLEHLSKQGYSCHVCKGFAAALKAWLEYINR